MAASVGKIKNISGVGDLLAISQAETAHARATQQLFLQGAARKMEQDLLKPFLGLLAKDDILGGITTTVAQPPPSILDFNELFQTMVDIQPLSAKSYRKDPYLPLDEQAFIARQEAIREHINELDADWLEPASIRSGRYSPSMINAFIWGPDGEWTGCARLKDMTTEIDKMLCYYSGRGRVSLHLDRQFGVKSELLVEPIRSLQDYRQFAHRFEHDMRNGRPTIEALARFKNYEDQARWCDRIGW